MFALAACGGSQSASKESGSSSESGSGAQSEQSGGEAEEEQGEGEEDTPDQTASAGSGDVLVLYFSAANYKDADTVSSATPVTDGAGAVEWIADIIHDEIGGDIEPIIPSKDYPTGYDDVLDVSKSEADQNERPAFEKLGVDPASYKTVFIGYPIWWYGMLMIMETLFDEYDLSGVTIVPFNTHEGSDTAAQEIAGWLDGLDLK